jgi:hypothetical protein
MGTVVVSLFAAFFVLMQFVWTTEEGRDFLWWGNNDEANDIFARTLVGRREVGANSRAISYSNLLFRMVLESIYLLPN